MNQNFWICRVYSLPAVQEDLLVEVAFRYGAEGVSQDLSFQQPSLEYLAESIDQDSISVQIYFLQMPSAEFAEEVSLRFPETQLRFDSQENQDWLAEWKKGFESFELVDGIWVVPSWLQPPQQAKQILKIDPGMAFGTGTHATTQLSALHLQKVISENSIQSVMDVGCGTGILAMLAQKMGVENVIGTDNDLEAIRVANENCALNDCFMSISNRDLPEFSQPQDVVVANIIDGVLLRLQDQLFRLTKKYLIVSGVLEERAENFIKEFHFEAAGLQLKSHLSKDAWNAYLFERNTSGHE